MNNAPEQLAAVFRAHEHLAPDAGQVLAHVRAGTTRCRRRRLVGAVTTAAAVVAVLVAAPLAVQQLIRRAEPPPPAAVPAFYPHHQVRLRTDWTPKDTWWLRFDRTRAGGLSRFTGGYYTATPPHHATMLTTGSSERKACFSPDIEKMRTDRHPLDETLMKPCLDPLPPAEQVDINGWPGRYRSHEDKSGSRPVWYAHVIWEISPGIWAGVNIATAGGEFYGDPAKLRATALRVARHARLVEPDRAD